MTPFILLAIAAVWGFAFWKNPERTFSLLPFILPTYVVRTNLGPIPTTALELIILATFIAWLFREIGDRRSEIGIKQIVSTRILTIWSSISPWKWPVGLWLLAGFISIFVSPNHIAALGLYRAYFIEPIMVFLIGFDLITRDRRSEIGDRKLEIDPDARRQLPVALTTSFALALIILGAYIVIQYLTGIGIPSPWNVSATRRVVGPFPFPNALALFVTPVAALLFADLVRGFNKTVTRLISPWLSGSAYLAGLLCIILAESDGGLIALGAASFIALVLNKKTRMLGIGLAVTGAILIGSVAPLRERAETVLMFREWSSKVRIVMWQETIAMLKEHKIMGAGLGGYPYVIRVYHKSGNWMEVFQYPHNIILNLWSEAGLLGLFAFGWILARWLYGLRLTAYGKINAVGRWPLALSLPVIIAILVHGLVDVPYFKNDLAVMFWLLILVTVFATDTNQDHK